MDISKLTARQKSVLLAKLMGWTVEAWATGDYGKRGEYHKAYWTRADGRVLDSDVVGFSEQEAIEGQVINFYAEGNFAEAWLVVNWAYNTGRGEQSGHYDFFRRFIEWYGYSQWKHQIIAMPLVEAQTAILDKILELAIEANLITLEQNHAPLQD